MLISDHLYAYFLLYEHDKGMVFHSQQHNKGRFM